jgi:hypothetical protein
MRIRTECVYPPIPVRDFDWAAVDDETYDGSGSLIGYGRTEEIAVRDLIAQLENEGMGPEDLADGLAEWVMRKAAGKGAAA